ncbi:MAG: HD domain-containing protein [Proteobacteria bacterium]|nr:HD domain-containing protein [Pseudomonadota bacterium]
MKQTLQIIRNLFRKRTQQENILSQDTNETLSEDRLTTPLIKESPYILTAQPIDSAIHDLYAEFVHPYKKEFLLFNSLEGTLNLLNILEKHGDCPSVRTYGLASNGTASQWHVLARVSLKDHSCRVARIIIALHKKEYPGSYLDLIPMHIITALGHDVGKIPAFGSLDNYATADHPIIGARVVRSCFAGHDTPWIMAVTQAIINHHRDSNDTHDRILRRADHLARGQELVLY